jgi:hypothetical protein
MNVEFVKVKLALYVVIAGFICIQSVPHSKNTPSRLYKPVS